MKNKWPYPVVWNAYDRTIHTFISALTGILAYNFLVWLFGSK